MSNNDINNLRIINPAAVNTELWPGKDGYPWADSGIRLWTREGLLRTTGDGHLVATWTTGGFSEPADGNFTVIRTSNDGGTTWQDAGRFQHPHLGLFTTELFTPGDGSIWAFLETYRFGEWMTGHRNYVSISRDHGQSWSTPHSIPGGVDNVWVNKGIVLKSGRRVLPVSWPEHVGEEWGHPSNGRSPQACLIGNREGAQTELPFGSDSALLYQKGCEWAHRNHRYVCGVILSDDGGKTFRRSGYVTHGGNSHLIEPRIVELEDNHLVMLIRSLDECILYRSESRNGGIDWTNPVPTDIPNPSAKVNLLKHSDGRIFLIHNPNDGKCDNGNFTMSARNPLSLWESCDNMQSWQKKQELVRDDTPGVSLNYPDGYLDEERKVIDFVWEDTYHVYRMQIPV